MTRTIVLLHGMGGDIDTMTSIGKHCARLLPETEFVSLEAPINLGSQEKPCLGWFQPPDDDKRALERPDPPQFSGIDRSLDLVSTALDQLISRGVNSRSIYLLGHSQGGAISITTGLTYPHPLGGIHTIAGYLAWLPTMDHSWTKNSFFLHHSLHDDVVGFRWADYTKSFIDRAGHDCRVQGWDIKNSPHFMHKRQLDAICGAILQT